jgi:hypothetical protein
MRKEASTPTGFRLEATLAKHDVVADRVRLGMHLFGRCRRCRVAVHTHASEAVAEAALHVVAQGRRQRRSRIRQHLLDADRNLGIGDSAIGGCALQAECRSRADVGRPRGQRGSGHPIRLGFEWIAARAEGELALQTLLTCTLAARSGERRSGSATGALAPDSRSAEVPALRRLCGDAFERCGGVHFGSA